jgi:hypothetical protein
LVACLPLEDVAVVKVAFPAAFTTEEIVTSRSITVLTDRRDDTIAGQ